MFGLMPFASSECDDSLYKYIIRKDYRKFINNHGALNDTYKQQKLPKSLMKLIFATLRHDPKTRPSIKKV